MTSCAFGNYQRDVITLFMGAKSSSLICNRYQRLRQRKLRVLPSGFQQALFAKFLSLLIHSFRNTIGIEEYAESAMSMVQTRHYVSRRRV